MRQTKFTRFKRITFIFIISIIMSFGIFNCQSNSTKANVIQIIDTVKIINNDTISKQDSIQEVIINDVSSYLKKQSPNAHKFIPMYIVQAGLNYDIDICFMMAQTQIETNFGTTGAGREKSRRSLFGVAVKRYENYEIAVNDYCKILKKSYLGRGKTEKHLMRKYVTHSGYKYAGNPNYEAELYKTYKYIVNKTNIYNLQQEWKSSL